MEKTPSQDGDRPEVLNLKQITSIKKLQKLTGQPDLLKELVDGFLKDAEVGLERLKGAIEADDHKETEQIAHKLKGAAGNLGALRLMATLGSIEDRAAEGLPLPEDSLERVGADFQEARRALLNETSP